MPELTSASALEAYVLLANGAKGAAAVGLIQQVLESQTVYVFGELLDHPNIKDLESNSTIPNGQGHFQLLSIFAYGLYADYEANKAKLPKITENMRKKLRLLTVASMANKEKTIQYDQLKTALGIGSIRELEDLIIEGTSNDVIRGKLDQKSSHFEVDYAMGRDIRKSDIGQITSTLTKWCDNCDDILACIETQVVRANSIKEAHLEHKSSIDKEVEQIRDQLKAKQQLPETSEDPDSRMETDRNQGGKKGGKTKGIRGSGKTSFWQK